MAVSAEELRRLIPGVDVPPEVVEATRRFLRGDGDDGDDGDDASRARPLTRADERAASKKRREERNAPVTSALHVPEGLVLDTTRYLASLWDAARLLASSGETPAGCSATMEIRSVASIEGDEELNAPNAYDAVVIACGAAAGSVRELEGDLLPTQLQGGHVVELVPDIAENGWPDGAPGVLGSPYIARRSRPSACWSGPPRSTARPSPTRGARGRYRSRTRKRRGRRLRRRARARGERGGDTYPPWGARRRGAWTWRGAASARTRRGRAWGRCRWSGASSRGTMWTRTETGAGLRERKRIGGTWAASARAGWCTHGVLGASSLTRRSPVTTRASHPSSGSTQARNEE